MHKVSINVEVTAASKDFDEKRLYKEFNKYYQDKAKKMTHIASRAIKELTVAINKFGEIKSFSFGQESARGMDVVGLHIIGKTNEKVSSGKDIEKLIFDNCKFKYIGSDYKGRKETNYIMSKYDKKTKTFKIVVSTQVG